MKNPSFQFLQLTARSRGAIACFALWGTGVEDALDSVVKLVGYSAIGSLDAGKFGYGSWKTGPLEGEDLMVLRVDASRLELHCHGSPIGTDLICHMFNDLGGTAALAEEYLLRNEPGWWPATSHQKMLAAPTRRTLELIAATIPRWPIEIRELRSMIQNREWARAQQAVRTILRWTRFGQHLTAPWRVILCGKTNVGKSSLINRLAGFERAVVHHVPGTTRDRISLRTALDGWPVELMDTAGLRVDPADSIERQGIELARQEIKRSDLVIAVFDASEPWTADDQQLWSDELRHGLLVWNKIDRAIASHRPRGIAVSAATGEGIDRLIATIVERLVPDHPEPGDLIPVSDAQVSRLRKLLSRLEQQKWGESLALLT